jgi:hypothetical protein
MEADLKSESLPGSRESGRLESGAEAKIDANDEKVYIKGIPGRKSAGDGAFR